MELKEPQVTVTYSTTSGELILNGIESCNIFYRFINAELES